MDRLRLTIMVLVLQIAVVGALWVRAEKRVSYLEGQQTMEQAATHWVDAALAEACGPYELPSGPRKGK